jgi:uncharacterized protein (TIGR02266 family)
VIALEIDRGLVRWLGEQPLGERVEIRHQDALRADLGGIARELGPPVVLLGNLPYRIAGRLLGALLGPRNPFRRWGLMLQSEVADRVLAEPGTSDYGPLAVWARLWVRKRRVVELGPSEFEPRPRVRSTFLVLDPAPDPLHVDDVALLRRVVRVFGGRGRTRARGNRAAATGRDALGGGVRGTGQRDRGREQAGVSERGGSMRRRRHLRVPVAVAIVTENGANAYAINLSTGGMCLQTPEALEVGSRLRVRFRVPGEKPITTDAEVVWADCDPARAPGPGLRYREVGVQFKSLGDRDRQAIEEFVDNRANFWPDEEAEEP